MAAGCLEVAAPDLCAIRSQKGFKCFDVADEVKFFPHHEWPSMDNFWQSGGSALSLAKAEASASRSWRLALRRHLRRSRRRHRRSRQRPATGCQYFPSAQAEGLARRVGAPALTGLAGAGRSIAK